MKIKLTVIAAVFVLLRTMAGAQGNEAVSITANPQVSTALPGHQAGVRVIIRIKPHPDNRRLDFELDAPDGDYGSAIVAELAGENSRTVFDSIDETSFGKNGVLLSPGHYTLWAKVYRANKKDPITARTEVVVRGGEDDDIDR